jgi:O-antigen/teichoic acid export membrane protein
MPLLTRLLTPAAYGEAALVATAISLLSVLALAGVDMSYSRHWVSGQVGAPDQVESCCWRWALSASAILAALVAFPIYVYWPTVSGARGLLVAFVCVGVVASALNTMIQARARLNERYRTLAIAQTTSALGAATLTLGAAYAWRQDALPLLAGALAGALLPLIWLRAPPPHLLLRPSRLSIAQRRSLLAVGRAGIVTAPAYWVLSSADRWFLAHYQGADVTGTYSLGAVVGTLGLVVSSAVTGSLLPELARAEAAAPASDTGNQPDPGRAEHLMWGVLSAVSVGVAAVGGELIRALADPRFHSAASLVPWFALGSLFYGCVHLGTARMVLANRLPLVAGAWVIGVAVSLVANMVVVPTHGAAGAAVVQVAAYASVMTLVWYQVQRHRPVQIQWLRVSAVAVCTGSAVLLLGSPWLANPWWAMATKACLALPVAGLLLALAMGPTELRRILIRN